MTASTLNPPVEDVVLCDDEFRPDKDIALLWAYEIPAAQQARAIIDTHRGDLLDIFGRVLRRIPNGRGIHESIRRDLLRLERPGALLHEHPPHRVGLVRPYRCTSEPAPPTAGAEPVILTLGDRETFFSFRDVSYARSWARRVQAAAESAPAWQAFLAERWPGHAAHFLPRIASTGRPHGFTELEAYLEDALLAEQRSRMKRLQPL